LGPAPCAQQRLTGVQNGVAEWEVARPVLAAAPALLEALDELMRALWMAGDLLCDVFANAGI
jgi:hypothetical protein